MDLICARKWTIWFSDEGAKFKIELSDGREFTSDSVFGAINRICHLPSDLFSHFSKENQTYVESEFHALLLSFLNEIPGPVLNQPSPRWLAGYMAYDAEWKKMANESGLPLYRSIWNTSDDSSIDYSTGQVKTVIIVNNQTIPNSLDQATQRACLRLAERTNCKILEVYFEEIDQTKYFLRATPFVNFQNGGKELVNTIRSLLVN